LIVLIEDDGLPRRNGALRLFKGNMIAFLTCAEKTALIFLSIAYFSL
jgi:hypothetical protein